MTANLFVSELMLLCVGTIATVVFWELYRRKDGWLRVVMMIYMAAEMIVYFGSAIYFWLFANHYTAVGIDTFRLLILPSKAVAMIVLMAWIRRNDGL